VQEAEPAEPPRDALETESELPSATEESGHGAIEALQARFEVAREQPAPEPPSATGAAELSAADQDGERQPPATEASAEPPAELKERAEPPAELEERAEPQAGVVSEEDVTELLTAMLDRLGAAHHRPFSRA
jgi:hypothetical protein